MFLSVALFLLMLSGELDGSAIDRHHIVSELSEIEAELQELNNGLDKASHSVSKLKSELSGESTSVQGADLIPLRACVRPLDAWRTILDGGLKLKLTLKYIELSDYVTVRWTDTQSVLPASYVELSAKVMESSVTLANNLASDSIILMFAFCGDKGNAQTYQFRIEEENSAHQVFVDDDMPVAELNSTEEIVYNVGQDAFIRLRTKQGEHRAGQVHTNVFLNFVDLQTGKFEMRPLGDYVNKSVEFLDSKNDVNSSEATVRIKMAERMKSGNIMILFFKAMKGSVISAITENFNIFIRPSNQTGPFPPGYIQIRISPYKQTDESGTTKESCRVNKVCPITCDAVGDDIQTVAFIQVNPDGTRAHLEPDPLSGINFGYGLASNYSMSNTIFVKVDYSYNTDVKYECVATNKQGKQATHYFAINAYIPLKIIKDQSSIAIENGKLNLTCTVTGWPQPTITFDMSTTGDQWYYSYIPDTVTYIGNRTYRATKLTDYDQAIMGDLMSVNCAANGIESYDHYSFNIPLAFDGSSGPQIRVYNSSSYI